MSYDIRFHTLAASNPALCWDIHHPDLWLECLTILRTSTSAHWSWPQCNSLHHFPDRYPFHSSRSLVPTPDNRQPSSLGTSANPQFPKLSIQQPNPPFYYCRDINNRGRCTQSHCTFCHMCGGSHTPLLPLILEWELRNHHDKTFVEQLLSDIRHGCDVGYSRPQS